jgi:hypothetical protein
MRADSTGTMQDAASRHLSEESAGVMRACKVCYCDLRNTKCEREGVSLTLL